MVAAIHAVSAFFHHSLLSFLLLNLLSTLPLDINCGGWSSGGIGGGAGSGSLFLLASASFSPKDYLKREHSLVKPYHGSAWDYGGSTMVTSNYVRLTSDKPSQAGIVWNRVPCHLRDWEMHIHFRIGNIMSPKELYGDGMAIWLTKERMTHGNVFGSVDYFQGLGIFLDTYSNYFGFHNHAHPYVSAVVSNGTVHYDHDKDGTHSELAGCEAQFRIKDYETFIMIRYENNKLSVKLDIENKQKWSDCMEVSGVRLPTGYYFGISASTGELSDIHDIISVKVYELENKRHHDQEEEGDPTKIIPSVDESSRPRAHHHHGDTNQWSNLTLFLCIFAILLGMALITVIGVVILEPRMGPSTNKFY